MVAAAVIGGAVIGAAGSAVAGSEAAGATTAASNAAIAEQQQALGQQATLSAPYRGLGESAIPLYEQLLGIGGTPSGGTSSATAGGVTYTMRPDGTIVPQLAGPGAGGAGAAPGGGSSAGILQALQSTPGYKFALSQGEQGIENAASAQGGITGNTLADLDKYNTGLAEGTYQQVLGDVQGAVGMGQAAAAGQASNIGTAASNIANIGVNQGNTMAGIDANTVAGITKSIGGASDQYLTMQALNSLNSQPGAGGGSDPAVSAYANDYNASLGYDTGGP